MAPRKEDGDWMSRHKILVVDGDPCITRALELAFGEKGYKVRVAGSAREALGLLRARPFDLVLTDVRLPDSEGMELLSRVKTLAPETQVILMTAHRSLDITIEAIKRGAYYIVEKSLALDQALMLVVGALQHGTVGREKRVLREALTDDGGAFGLIGRDARMRRIRGMIRTAAPSDAPVLIEGESGTGKERIATALHVNSDRAGRPFIGINCAAIPHHLIESELFGYQKGAFTGAGRDRRGLIEAAEGGTLLLDEIAEMPPHLQTKLLRVLQDRKLRRVGGEQEIAVNFRLVSSTNRDTARMIQDGTLRKDLYFRISTIKIKVPPLRERLGDVALLAEHCLRRCAERYQRCIRGISLAALSLLTRYEWPGNVRELESVIEHAVLFAREDQILPHDLPDQLHAAAARKFRCLIPPHMTMEEIEHAAIMQTLERTGGNVKKTAELLNYHRPKLYRRLRKFGLKDARPPACSAAAPD
jgi:DNA-binding NtrC family response regulator